MNNSGFILDPLEARVLFVDTHLAMIGDFSESTGTRDVANLIKSWSPQAVVTVGDNNYPDGAASTIDANIGQYFQQYIYPYKGSYGPGATDGVNRFWPALGNHDYNSSAGYRPYTDYFALPNNERYYAKQINNVALFVINSDTHEPDGISASSKQATWIKNAMLASTATWKLVVLHHPPYSSGAMGSNTVMQWPFKDWGATAVFSGHEHDYERLSYNGLTYFVNGLGGAEIQPFGTIRSGSQVRYNADNGAMKVDSTDTSITFKFIARSGAVIDSFAISNSSTTPTSATLVAAGATWKYLDTGATPASTWTSLGFDDSGWKSGPAQLGYGDGDEKTVVSYGPSATSKYITTHFRRTFNVDDASKIAGLTLNLLRDDGAVVYLNGVEIYRSNMPGGAISGSTLASTTVGGAEESAFYTATMTLALNTGANVLAVEVHQSVPDSSDLSFDLSLNAALSTTTPGPMPAPEPSPAPSPAPGLPAGWLSKDIGSVTIAGSASGDGSGNFTVSGSGSDIWNSADGFQFVYQSLSGDGQIVARVASMTNTQQWAKAGVMMRETLDAGSKEVSVVVTPGADVVMLSRTATGGSTSATFASGAAPYWVKLVRAGSTFTGYRSADGSTWTKVSSVSVAMGSTIYVGLAVCSKNAAMLNTSTFTNVGVIAATVGITPSSLTARQRDLVDVVS